MSTSLPPYIQRRGSVFYFRQVVPKNLRYPLGRREHIISLRTSNIRVATLRAASLIIEAERLHRAIISGHLSHVPAKELKTIADRWLKGSILPEPYISTAFLNTAPPFETMQGQQVQHSLLPPMCESTPHAYPIAGATDAPQQTNKHPPQHPTGSPADLSTTVPTVNELLVRYCDDKVNSGTWSTAKTQKDAMVALKEFCAIIGDISLSSFTRDTFRQYRDILSRMPKRRTVMPHYRNKSVAQLASMDIPKADRLTSRTIKNHFVHIKSFTHWLDEEGYISNPKRLTSILIPPKETKASSTRAFTNKELTALFHSTEYLQDSFTRSYQYWMPIILLFTGARREEIAQLMLEDIRLVDDLWCIDINNSHGKHLKTVAANRIIPIHPFLMEAGILQRVEAMKKQKHSRLFPLLTPHKYIKRGNRVSQWFTNYRRKCGVGAGKNEQSNVRLHSFRNTLAAFCKQRHIPRTMLKELIGHEHGGDSDVTSTYEGRYPLHQLAEELVYRIDYAERLNLHHVAASKWVVAP